MLELTQIVDDALNEEFDERVENREDEIVAAVMQWLTTEARLKQVPDLNIRFENMRVRLERLVKNMKVRLADKKLVIKVSGSDEETLKMFRLGSAWFEPHPNVTELFLVGLFDELV